MFVPDEFDDDVDTDIDDDLDDDANDDFDLDDWDEWEEFTLTTTLDQFRQRTGYNPHTDPYCWGNPAALTHFLNLEEGFLIQLDEVAVEWKTRYDPRSCSHMSQATETATEEFYDAHSGTLQEAADTFIQLVKSYKLAHPLQ